MINENAGEETPVLEQRDAIVLARDYLRRRFKEDKVVINPQTGSFDTVSNDRWTYKDKEDSCERISAFLGTAQWNSKKVERLLTIADGLDEALLKDVVPSGTTHPDRQKKLGQQTAVVLTQLEKPAQKAAA